MAKIYKVFYVIMTECERIIRDGILPASFFEEETICDFFVTRERKKIWAISLDMLIQVDRICRKYKIKYFMAFGSLLGIVRHKGFIPWDDDVDICMPREDYEKFIAIAPSELPPPYFLQVPGVDFDYCFSFTKLRNSNSTGIGMPFRYCKFNQGLGIDIFVLDNCCWASVEENWRKLNNLIMECSAYMRRSNPKPSNADIEKIQKFPKRPLKSILTEIDDYCNSVSQKPSDYCIPLITTYKPQKMIYKWEDVLDLTDVDFYGYKFLIPKNSESILTTTYGNYMEFPPVEERGTWHNTSIIDPDKPYKEFLKELIAKENDKNA